MPFIELDQVVASDAGRSIEEIFADEGEHAFRRRESEALGNELRRGEKVISCGGGVVLRDDNVQLLRQRCRVYLLKVSSRTALQRLRGKGGRPLLEGVQLDEEVGRIMEERSSKYASAAHEIIEADDASPEVIAEEIARRWRKYR